MATESVTIPAAAIPDLRRMLAIGMHALGEVERVRDHVEMERDAGRKVPDALMPLHPTGAHEMSAFAGAMLWLESATPAGG